MRSPQAWCRACKRAHERARRRSDPELQFRYNSTYWRRLKQDPERHAIHLAKRRDEYGSDRPVGRQGGPRGRRKVIPMEPLRRWLKERDVNARAFADAAGIHEDRARHLLEYDDGVTLETADRAILGLSGDPSILSELYPDW